jgi:hypothetical protein
VLPLPYSSHAATEVPESAPHLVRRRHRSKELKIRIIRRRGESRSNKWRRTPASLVVSVFVDMVTPSVSNARASNCISFSITWRIEDVLRREGRERQDEFSSRPCTGICKHFPLCACARLGRRYVNCCGLLYQLETVSSGAYSAQISRIIIEGTYSVRSRDSVVNIATSYGRND